MNRPGSFFLAAALASLFATAPARAQDKLEIFSWWAGDEGPALKALIDLYSKKYPNIQVINSTVTGGSGVNARAVLKTRMLGGDPPDSFQVHAGQELIGTWVVANRMEDLSDLFKSEGWMAQFPKGLIALLSARNGIWSVPVNIHRSNVMWYVPANLKKWGVSPPKTLDEFMATCKTLQGKGVQHPLALGENWTYNHLWEASPGTGGVFMMLSDSLGLPKGVKHRDAALKWLRELGSKEGQDTFNPLKGSIAARLDSDLSKYNAYLQSAAKDWKTNKVVGSLAHGAVAPEAFASQFGTVMEIYLANKNAEAAANAAQAIADQVGLGK